MSSRGGEGTGLGGLQGGWSPATRGPQETLRARGEREGWPGNRGPGEGVGWVWWGLALGEVLMVSGHGEACWGRPGRGALGRRHSGWEQEKPHLARLCGDRWEGQGMGSPCGPSEEARPLVPLAWSSTWGSGLGCQRGAVWPRRRTDSLLQLEPRGSRIFTTGGGLGVQAVALSPCAAWSLGCHPIFLDTRKQDSQPEHCSWAWLTSQLALLWPPCWVLPCPPAVPRAHPRLPPWVSQGLVAREGHGQVGTSSPCGQQAVARPSISH